MGMSGLVQLQVENHDKIQRPDGRRDGKEVKVQEQFNSNFCTTQDT